MSNFVGGVLSKGSGVGCTRGMGAGRCTVPRMHTPPSGVELISF